MKSRGFLLILGCLLFTWVVLACNLPNQAKETYLKIKLDDSLSTYDTLRVDILYPDGTVYRDSAFYGKYIPDADHELKNINLGENPPSEFKIRITGIRGGKRSLEIAIPVTSTGAQPSQLVFRDTTKAPEVVEPQKVEIITPSPVVLFTRASAFAISASVQPMGAESGLLWRSSDSGVGQVDSTGKVLPLKAGEADIIARSRRDTTLFAILHLVVKDSVLIKGIKVSSDSLLLYTGGESHRLIGEIDPAGVDLSVVFICKNDTVATAGADGTISPAKIGKTEILVFPAGMPELAVVVPVTVKTDMPKLDAGPDRFAKAKDTLSFPLKVTQDHGTVAALKWDLDGNGIWDDSTGMAEANPRRMYDGKDSLVRVRFYARDSEGNVVLVDRQVHVGQRMPLAAPSFTSATTPSPTRIVRPTWAWAGSPAGSGRFLYVLDNRPEIETRALTFTADSLSDGEHTIVLRELDSLGEPSLPARKALKIVTKGPLVAITSPATGLLTKAESVNVSWSIKAQDGTTTTSTNVESLAGKQGSIWIVRSEADVFGNRGSDSVRIFRDTIPPAMPVFTAQTSPAVVNAAYTSPVKWEWTRTGVANDSFLVSLNGGSSVRMTGNTYVLANPQNQIYSLEVREVDSAGNASIPNSFIIQIDKAAPPAPAVNGVTPIGTPVWTWTPGPSSDGTRTYRYKLSTASGYSSETSATTHSLPNLGTGSYTLLVQERDLAGNWSVDGAFTIEVDKAGPIVAVGKPTPLGSVTNSNPTISGSISDNHSIRKAEYKLNGGTYVPLTLSGSNWSFKDSCDAGLNSIWIRGEDQFGNRDSVNIKIYKYPKVVFVRKNSTGTGKSWEDALGELYMALDSARHYPVGTEIWASGGSYGGSPENPNELPLFHSDITIKGGFYSNRPSLDSTQRDFSASASTITKIVFLGADGNAVHDMKLDGFTLADRLWLANADHYRLHFRNLMLENITSTQSILLTRGSNIHFEKCVFKTLKSTEEHVMVLKGTNEFTDCRFESLQTGSGYSPINMGASDVKVRQGYFAGSKGDLGNYHFYLNYSGQTLDIQGSSVQGGKAAIFVDPSFPVSQFIYSGNTDF